MDLLARKTRFPSGSLLFHGSALSEDLKAGLEQRGIEIRSATELLGDPGSCDAPAALILDHTLLPIIAKLENLPDHVALIAADAETESRLGDAIDLSLVSLPEPKDALRALRTALELSADRRDVARAQLDLTRSREELAELNRIGIALMTERNRATLLRQILNQVIQFTTSDAGALFLAERPAEGTPRLRFILVLSGSVSDLRALDEMTFPIDSTSLAGHVAETGVPLVVEDANDLPPDAGFTLNRSIQDMFGYRLKSMMTIPMINHRGEVVGVLQLANRKCDREIKLESPEDVRQYVIPYSDRDVQLGLSLAAQAAVSIENAQLYEQIEHLFESFVKAAVTAIDQRDPTTAGHSIRVATLATDLAQAVERSGNGAQRRFHFSAQQMRELRYAALLHDFGKVGVRETVLIKAKKLPPELWARVEGRFELIRCTMELEYEREASKLRRRGKNTDLLDEEFKHRLAELDNYWRAVLTANEPTVLPAHTSRLLTDLVKRQFARDGHIEPYLTTDELHYLQIPRGSLDERERQEIETHAQQTFQFLSQIPWTDDLKDIASYASSHHEKLNGSGYPHRLSGEDIPIQTRLITIADVFDALTAADRPYKPAVNAQRALDIIQDDANSGLLDPELVRIMIESQVYRHVLEEDWRRL